MINFLKPKVIILIFFSFYGQLVSAGKVTIAVDEKNIELGSSVNLSISVTGDLEKEVELPTIDGLSVHGSGSSTNVSWINGTYGKTVSYNFYLTPEKLGRIQIPPLEFKIDGRVEKTRSIYLNVSKAGQQIDSPTEDDSAPLAFHALGFAEIPRAKRSVTLVIPHVEQIPLSFVLLNPKSVPFVRPERALRPLAFKRF